MNEHKPARIHAAVGISEPFPFVAAIHMDENMEHSGDAPLSQLNRRRAEKELLSVICTGNPLLLEAYLDQNLSNFSIGIMSREALNQQRYLCIVITAILCRAVMDAGVPEQIAFGLSDSFIQKADQMHRPEQLMEFSLEVMRMYCQAVQDYQMPNASPPVRKCCEYMMAKLHSNITLQELSEVCHLSRNYISDLFRKELGISALRFFQKRKLQYAKHLVLYSDWNIAKISAHLSYPSQSNFTQQFKKEFGRTPMQFRMSH